jgi:para-nitrobenzyl esterase
LANPGDAHDLDAVHRLQDAIRVEQDAPGKFEVPGWDVASQAEVRKALSSLAPFAGHGAKFGSKNEVDPVAHLIGTAIGWGGNPPTAATYVSAYPKRNDGKAPHSLTVRDVPVDGFWSISVYNAKGFFEENDFDAYSLNNFTAKPNEDGSYTIRFGACEANRVNCLPITPGWNYTVRLYKPRQEILDGTWHFPAATPYLPKP